MARATGRIEGIAVAGSLGLVVLVRLLSGVGPAEAPARTRTAGAAETTRAPAAREPSAAERAAAAWVAAASVEGAARSPFSATIVETRGSTGAGTRSGALVLTGVLGRGERCVATINGRVYRVGDEVSPGTVVASIDAQRVEVELRLPDGSTTRLGRSGR